MAVNKVVLGEDTLIDLTGDTVSADKLSKGVTAHDMAGEPIVGTMEAGGGKVYTFTDGLTETDGTVKWNLNDRIKKGSDNTSNNTSVVLNTDTVNAVSNANHTANGKYATAVGKWTRAEGDGSFAQGYTDSGWLNSGGIGSHVEGYAPNYYGMTVFGKGAHGEGYIFYRTRDIQGAGAHAEGADTLTNGYACHAEGNFTDALSSTQHVQGKYNIKDSNGVFQDIIGNGSADESRSNASALDWNGNLYISGKIYQDCTDYSTNSSGLVTPRCGGTPVSGGGSSYTFTNGLTETDGTVSWDLNDRIISKSGSILQITSNASSGQLNIQAGPSGSNVGTILVTNNGNIIFLKPKLSGSQVMLDSENKTLSPYNSPLLDLGSTSNKWNNGYFNGNILANNIPAPPTSDGSYNLHLDIVDGVPTYSWKAK